ncbi:MAG: VOC family protein, partial [Bacteroidia bacterium]
QADADRLFNALSAGGHILMPIGKTFWGAYFGMFIDRFGINWMINFDQNPM